MIRKQIFIPATLGALLGAVTSARAAEPSNPGPPPSVTSGSATTVPVDAQLQVQSEQQKVLYALGLALSQGLVRLDLQQSELAYVAKGLQDGVLANPPVVQLEEYAPKVQELAQQRLASTTEREQAVAKDFLARRAAEPGAVRTDSGIVVVSRQEGTGPSPTRTDTVRVNYEGLLPDGKVFDSSVQRGAPASFPLDQVIPCWSEVVPTMKVGGKVRVVCPPALAYGAEGRPGIPPNSPLIFDIHLLGIGDTATAAPGSDREVERDPLEQQVAALMRKGARPAAVGSS